MGAAQTPEPGSLRIAVSGGWQEALGALEGVSYLVVLLVAGAVIWCWLRRSDEPRALVVKSLWTLVLVFGLGYLLYRYGFRTTGGMVGGFGVAALIAGGTAAVGIIVGVLWAPHLGAWLARPITQLYDGGLEEDRRRPLYSTAEALRKRGQYAAASAEVRRQLAGFPNDFQGLLLLAEIEAVDLGDLPAAEERLEGVVADPSTSPAHCAIAFHRLADWQLTLRRDPGAARQALERIVDRFPGTEMAAFASQRIAHLASAEYLAEQAHPSILAVEPMPPPPRVGEPVLAAPRVEPTAAEQARSCLNRLAAYPEDEETREQLALIYARDYRRLDLASDQLEQLIAHPHAAPRRVAHWLHLLADLHLQLAGDLDAARATLQRIIDRDPRAAAAATAQTRLSTLALELRGRRPQGVVAFPKSGQGGPAPRA